MKNVQFDKKTKEDKNKLVFVFPEAIVHLQLSIRDVLTTFQDSQKELSLGYCCVATGTCRITQELLFHGWSLLSDVCEASMLMRKTSSTDEGWAPAIWPGPFHQLWCTSISWNSMGRRPFFCDNSMSSFLPWKEKFGLQTNLYVN